MPFLHLQILWYLSGWVTLCLYKNINISQAGRKSIACIFSPTKETTLCKEFLTQTMSKICYRFENIWGHINKQTVFYVFYLGRRYGLQTLITWVLYTNYSRTNHSTQVSASLHYYPFITHLPQPAHQCMLPTKVTFSDSVSFVVTLFCLFISCIYEREVVSVPLILTSVIQHDNSKMIHVTANLISFLHIGN